MIEKYKQYNDDYQMKIKQLDKKCMIIGFFKLVLTIIVLSLLVFMAFNETSEVQLVFLGVSFVLCVVFWIYHGNEHRRLDYYKGISKILTQYMKRINGEWTQFEDQGEEYVDYNHPYTFDLDIFGPKSLFQRINITHTFYGRQALVKDLSDAQYSNAIILERQEAISELAEKDIFTFDFQYYASQARGKTSNEGLYEGLKERLSLFKSNAFKLVRFIPVFTILFALIVYLFSIKPLYFVSFALFVLQLLIWIILSMKTNEYLGIGQSAKFRFQRYSEVFEQIENETFESNLLKEIKEDLITSNISASKSIKQLDKIIQGVEIRSNVIVYTFLNVFFLWDINCALHLEKWINQNVEYLTKWFERLGQLESLLSLSTLSRVVEQTTYPEISDVAKFLQTEAIGHPLIEDNVRVYNDFKFHNTIEIISGSNMSGKTTFLRTIGINLVLAKSGAQVCAKKMAFSDFEIITSMRITDDLNEGVSTFYAELKKIKKILTLAETNENTLFLVDEIFKGTNSVDRIQGAKKIIKKLYTLKTSGFLTTHDLSLCEYDDGTKVDNWHFSEQIIDGKISFDYKIKPGIATTTNGEFLMQMLKIID